MKGFCHEDEEVLIFVGLKSLVRWENAIVLETLHLADESQLGLVSLDILEGVDSIERFGHDCNEHVKHRYSDEERAQDPEHLR